LALIRERTAVRRSTPQREIVILADPVFSPEDERLPAALHSVSVVRPEALNRSLAESGLSFPRLSFSSGEARAIANVSAKEKAVVKLGVDANRNFATSSELENFRIVHFATHGLLNTEVPSLSGIVLSLIDKQGNPQDGFLRLHEIYNLHLNADLVVLSACQTALGEQLKGEGAISLSRGFFYAGAARVVASLWTVNDSSTAKLMTAFYRNMQSLKMTPAAALRAAQIEMQQAGQSPYNWAAFELQGEWK
jgi:CHAT domain-containing protein